MIKQQSEVMQQKLKKIKEFVITIKKLKTDINTLKEEASIYKTEEKEVVKVEVDKEKLKQSIKETQNTLSNEITSSKRELEAEQKKLLELKGRIKKITHNNKVNSYKITEAMRISNKRPVRNRMQKSIQYRIRNKKSKKKHVTATEIIKMSNEVNIFK